MINTKTKGELGNRIEYDVEHNLFHPQNVYSEEYITPTFIEYVRKLEQTIEQLKKEQNENNKLKKNTWYNDRLNEAKEIIEDLLDTQYALDPYRDIYKDRVIRAEKFVKGE